MTVLVTGAAGKTGLAVLEALRRRQIGCRALVRRLEQAPQVQAKGANEVVLGDLRERDSLIRAVAGVDRIYHICPNMCADELEIAERLIELAESRGVEHFVFHSVLHPQVEAMPHHWRKLRVEERLFASDLAFTVLQPSAYLQNLMPYWRSARDDGHLALPFSVDSPISMVDLEDVALVAAQVLGEGARHRAAIYELCGPPTSHRQVCDAFSRALGRPVEARQISVDDWRQNALASGLGKPQCAELVAMFQYYDRFGLVGNANVLGWLLGRSPTSLDDFVGRLERQSAG